MTRTFAFLGLVTAGMALTALTGCQTPVDTRGVTDAQISGRCRLIAAQEDRGHISFGLIPMAISAYNANMRRQEIYDACVVAAGSRESPPETLPVPPVAAAQ